MDSTKSTVKSTIAEAWERQPDESAQAFNAFAVYRDMGTERSNAKVGQKLGKTKTIIDRWSSNNAWVIRAAEWDKEQDRIGREAQLKEIRKMRAKHAKIAEAMLTKAAKALMAIPDDEIKAADISRMVDVATRLERISRGDVEVVGHVGVDGSPIDPPIGVQIYIPDNGRGEGT